MASEKRQLTQQEKAAKQRLHVAAELILIGIPIALIVGIKFLPRECSCDDDSAVFHGF